GNVIIKTDATSAYLYYEGSNRLNSTSVGINIPKDLDVDGHTNLDNVSIAGFTTITQDLNVDGHTNLDNVSIAGVTTIADDKKLYLGNDQDLELFYQTSGVPGAYINTGNASGNLTIRNQDAGQYVYIHGDNVHLRSTTNNETFLQAQHNGAVSLYYDNVKRFETTNQGINVIG
ncbi:MAG: hypothetical protein VXY93_21965, partial [Pseudomonadota bacterium]|nr:hypothetical protein [Pseudomonadota bacterium]